MINLAILLAELEDVIGVIVFFVVAVAVWLFQAVGKMLQQGRPQRPVRPGQAGRAQGGLQEEIGEFLRKAAQGQRRPQQQPPPVPDRPQPGPQAVRAEVGGHRQPARADLALERARQAAEAARARARAQRTGPAPPQPASRPRPEPQRRPASPKRQPEPILDAAVVSEPAAETLRAALGSAAVATARPESTAMPTGAAAAGIHAMLSNPDNLRQAIILSEILNRPTDRW